MLSKTENIYDSFTTPQLDPNKWTIAAFPTGNGDFWRWEEPHPVIKTGDGKLEITVNPYTRFHNQVQIFDNPKHLLLGTQAFPVPQDRTINFSFQMGGVTHNGNPDDFRDGFASFNVLDFQTGLVFDFIFTSTKIGVICERLLIPGLTTPKQAFTEIIPVAHNQPEKLSFCQINYNSKENRVEFWLEKKKVYSQDNISVKPSNLFMGMGLITLRPILIGQSKSCHGQGGAGVWSNIRVRS